MFWDLDRALHAPASAVAALPPWRALPFHSFAEDGRYALFDATGSAPFVWDIDTAAPAEDAELIEALVRSARRFDLTQRALVRPHAKIATKGHPIVGPSEHGHTAPVLGWDEALNLRWEATASEDGTVRIWDLAAVRLLAVFSDATIFERCIWATDSVTLAAIDYRGRTHLLRLEGIAP